MMIGHRLAAAGLTLLLAGTVHARAATFSLGDVTFSDGGTAAGAFDLNVLGYISSAQGIVTTPGTILTSGVSYDPAQQTQQSGTPPSTDFDISSAGYVFDLHLAFAEPLTPSFSGPDALVPGGGTPGNYTGSYEECVSSPTLCGVAFQTARFITGGNAQIPEPAPFAILGLGTLASIGMRRRRS